MTRFRHDDDVSDYRLNLWKSDAYRQQCLEEAEAQRRAFDASRAHLALPRRTEADRICQPCLGSGQITDRHAYGPDCHVRCHACDGRGFL